MNIKTNKGEEEFVPQRTLWRSLLVLVGMLPAMVLFLVIYILIFIIDVILWDTFHIEFKAHQKNYWGKR